MTELLLIKFAHLLCLVYWLGGDLGVFYSSFSVIDENKSPEVRVNAAKIMFALDQGPRICMPLILATGVHLAGMMGRLDVPGSVIFATWVVCIGWLAMVLILHFGGHGRDLSLLTRFDFIFRIVVIVLLLATGIGSITGLYASMAPYIGWKVSIFALTVLCGLIIRIYLKPFGPAFARLARGDVDESVNRDIRQSLSRCRPFVMAIWIGLLFSSAFGLRLLP